MEHPFLLERAATVDARTMGNDSLPSLVDMARPVSVSMRAHLPSSRTTTAPAPRPVSGRWR